MSGGEGWKSSYSLHSKVSPPLASQHIDLVEAAFDASELEVEDFSELIFAEACTYGEENESAAAAFIALAWSDLAVLVVAVISSEERSLPPS